MATNEDLGAQLKMQQDINKALQQRAGLLSKNTKEISTQVQLAAELCNAMECKDLEGMNDRLGEIQQSLSQVAEEADKAGTSTSDGMAKGAKSAEKAGKSVQKGVVDGLNAAKVAAVGFGVGIVSGVRSAVKQIKGLAKSIGNVTKLARAGALSSLGARLEIASPIDRKRVPPKKEKRKIFNHANKLPCPIDTPRINMPIVNRIIV